MFPRGMIHVFYLKAHAKLPTHGSHHFFYTMLVDVHGYGPLDLQGRSANRATGAWEVEDPNNKLYS